MSLSSSLSYTMELKWSTMLCLIFVAFVLIQEVILVEGGGGDQASSGTGGGGGHGGHC